MQQITAFVPDPAGLLDPSAFGAGALVRWENGAAIGGPFTEQGTRAITIGTSAYIFWDPTGTPATWYRTRYSDSGGSLFSDYGAPFSPSVNYATLDDVLDTFETTITDPRKLRRMTNLLTTATNQVIEACGHRDYFRHPATGVTTWVMDGDGSDTLHIHEGLVRLDLLELSFDGGRTYVPVNGLPGSLSVPSDYTLRGDSPYVSEPIIGEDTYASGIPPSTEAAVEPYFHVRFTGFGKYVTFVPTVRAARLTGVRGWPAIPAPLVEATAQRVRQLEFGSAGYSGGAAGGEDQYGRVSSTDRFWPQSMYNFLQAEHSRFMACHMGSTGDAQLAWR
jgi:hypothetical protein